MRLLEESFPKARIKYLILTCMFLFLPPNGVSAQTTIQPVFFLFNRVRFKSKLLNLNAYTDSLLDKLGPSAKKKVWQGNGCPIPAALIENDVIPAIGQKVWKVSGFTKIDQDQYKEYVVTNYHFKADPFNADDICFGTNAPTNENSWDDIYAILPVGEYFQTVYKTPLTLHEIKDIFLRAPKTYEIAKKRRVWDKQKHEAIGVKQFVPRQLDKKGLLDFQIQLADAFSNIKVISLTKYTDDHIKGLSLIDFGNKVVIRYGELIGTVFKFDNHYFFVMTRGGGGGYTKTIYELNGEKFDAVYTGGLITD